MGLADSNWGNRHKELGRPDTGRTRAERAAVAVRLRQQGLKAIEIAQRMGVSRSYASALYSDPDGAKERERKASYGGRCEICGKRTDGSNGPGAAPRYCIAHIGANEEWIANITKWTRELLIARIREWARLYGEPPAVPDWGPTVARRLGDEERARRFEEDDYWPWFASVVYCFGSWNAGIAAAGFEPRAANGGSGNQQRRRR